MQGIGPFSTRAYGFPPLFPPLHTCFFAVPGYSMANSRPLHAPPGDQFDATDSTSVRVSRTTSAQLSSRAKQLKTSSGAIIAQLLKLNEQQGLSHHTGSINTLAASITRLEEAQLVCADTVVELCRNLVGIAARLDDGSTAFLARLLPEAANHANSNEGATHE